MVLSGKEKAVAAFIITLVLGIIGTLLAFSGLPADVKPFLDLAVAIITVVGSTLGVYGVTNSTGGTNNETAGGVTPPVVTATTNVGDAPVTAPVADPAPAATGTTSAGTDNGLTDPAPAPTTTVGDA